MEVKTSTAGSKHVNIATVFQVKKNVSMQISNKLKLQHKM